MKQNFGKFLIISAVVFTGFNVLSACSSIQKTPMENKKIVEEIDYCYAHNLDVQLYRAYKNDENDIPEIVAVQCIPRPINCMNPHPDKVPEKPSVSPKIALPTKK